MKILHVIPNLVKGGAQRIAIDICQELSKRADVEVMLVYFEGENEFSFLTKGLCVRKLDITFNMSFTSKNTIELSSFESLLDEFQPNIVHSHLYLAELITREKTRPNIQYFTHCHDNIRQFRTFRNISLISKTDLIEYLEKKRLFKRYNKCNNTFIVISGDGLTFLKNNLSKKLIKKITFLPNAINLFNFKTNGAKKDLSEISLINVGNLIPKKNQQFLIEIVHLISSKNKKIKLSFTGDGESRPLLEQKAKLLGISNLINFMGRQDDIGSILNTHAIYVHSALYEPFGLVIIEAMASGLPVVSLDGKGNKDIIENNENGYLVPQGNITLFAERILELANSPENYSRIQQNGFETAKNYDIVPYCNRLLEIYTNSKNK